MTLHRRHLLAALPALLALPQPASAEAQTRFFIRQEQKSGDHFGLYAHDLATGRKLTWRENDRFVMCSTFKMSLVACVLSRVDRGQEHLARVVNFGAQDLQPYAPAARQNLAKGGMTVAAMCQATVELSDNTCANLLLASIGGPPALTQFWRETGDPISQLEHNEPMLNRTPLGGIDDTTTPAAMAGNMQRFLLSDVLQPQSRDRLTNWMLDCQTGKDLLRAGLPGWKVADKTGNNAKDALGDLALAWPPTPGGPIVICVYTRGNAADTDPLRPIFAEIGQLVASQLG